MIFQHLNWLSVAISAIAYFALGAIWFNQKVFGTMWMKGHNIGTVTEEDKKRMPIMMLSTLILCFIGATAMGYFSFALNSLHPGVIEDSSVQAMKGAKLGAIAGIGFSGIGIAMNYLYTRKSFLIIAIDASYHVIGMIITGIITSVWR